MGSAERAVATDDVATNGTCPWIGYDDQDVRTIARFVAKSSPTQAREVGEYERANNDRAAVTAAADRRLAQWKA